jgi:hypothetical protein
MAPKARDAVLPGSLSAVVNGMAEPMVAPMAVGKAPSRKARGLGSVRSRSKRSAPSAMTRTKGRRRDDGGENRAAEPVGGVADDRNGLHDRSGCGLTEGDGEKIFGINLESTGLVTAAIVAGWSGARGDK